MYNEQRDKGIALFVSSWIKDVIRQRLPPEGVAVGKYLLPPSTVYWRAQKPYEPVRATVDPAHPATAQQGSHVTQAASEAEVGACDVDLLWDQMERSSETIDTKSESHKWCDLSALQIPCLIITYHLIFRCGPCGPAGTGLYSTFRLQPTVARLPHPATKVN